ncbi:putative PLP-dependent enzyme possibly involved in cell wall biogenesis [Thermanaerovibrio velox DSM 12556]|uniref:Putative PLP-dependent enzyme possibly involved in cell wall biogenesis n=1 Tax=Thermanaerovibrio velox DSM 12556 TaxID=926567 RepID=H0UND6_9BACT|nr:DegT/DnrJ/EryC1/StrS family aminotransferase [Thermanaerovibrio velox]EHM09343.1 putative PLP-dependent enzyme possibly involved in cell wall biogenesis [Thermanaerovibrio velox DSM 12556]
MSSIPSFDLKRNYERVRQEVRDAVDKVLESQHFVLGPEVKAFEDEFASYLGVPHAVGCASGSDALLLALMAIGVGPGDEVITTPFTFFASTSCISRLGARAVYVDVDMDTYNMRMDMVMDAVTPRTKAVLPVHIFGQMCPLEEIASELKDRGIALVEDCAQSFGAVRRVDGNLMRGGAVGDVSCFSFFPTKNLGCYGDGGLVASADPEMDKRLRSLRVHGSSATYFHDEVGLNSRLDEIQAAILRVRLRHAEQWNEERRAIAERYRLLFAAHDLLEFVTPPVELEGNRHVFHQYVVRAKDRDELQRFLAQRGITTRVYYPLSLHLQPCFRYLGYKEGDFPASEALTRQVLALPMFPELTPEEQETVVLAMKDFYRR